MLNVYQAEDVRQLADNELGFQQVSLSCPSQAKTYLFVNSDRVVIGCLIAEHIRQVKTIFSGAAKLLRSVQMCHTPNMVGFSLMDQEYFTRLR